MKYEWVAKVGGRRRGRWGGAGVGRGMWGREGWVGGGGGCR